MRKLTFGLSLACITLITGPAFALDRVVSIESPVQIIRSTPDGTSTNYVVEDQSHVRYHVILPQAESDRLAMMIKDSPSAVIRFDGTVVNDNDGGQSLRVENWKRVTTTTTETDRFGNTTQEKTTVLKKE